MIGPHLKLIILFIYYLYLVHDAIVIIVDITTSILFLISKRININFERKVRIFLCHVTAVFVNILNDSFSLSETK